MNCDPRTVCTLASVHGAAYTTNGHCCSLCITLYKLPLPLAELLYIINDLFSLNVMLLNHRTRFHVYLFSKYFLDKILMILIKSHRVVS